MAYYNVKMPEVQVKFDWDDIDVGNDQLDHSENFFGMDWENETICAKTTVNFQILLNILAIKHYEHERLEDIGLLEEEMGKY